VRDGLIEAGAGGRAAGPDGPAAHYTPAQRMSRSVLIIEQGFLKPRGSKPVHGVELFRLNLIRDLIQRGVSVSLVAERSWRGRIEEFFAQRGVAAPECFFAPALAGVPGAGLIGTVRAQRSGRSRRWDTVMFGNARLGMVPAMHWAVWMELAPRCLLFAHRDPGGNFLDAVSTLAFDTVANSEWVAQWYRGQTGGRVDVYYGLTDAERFVPRESPAGGPADGLVHFCLLGRLPNISKGQERAIAALRAVPEPLRSRIRLHLVGFAPGHLPDFADPCIVPHAWMNAAEVPPLLRLMDAMLTISTHETFSQAIVQGMLTGLPVIASDIPVYAEKLDVRAGTSAHERLVAPMSAAEIRIGGILTRSVQEVTDAIIRLASDPSLRARLGGEGRRVALERYVWSTGTFIERHLFPR
jgi:glycosyltransferase involved in cell wall biosynthesis